MHDTIKQRINESRYQANGRATDGDKKPARNLLMGRRDQRPSERYSAHFLTGLSWSSSVIALARRRINSPPFSLHHVAWPSHHQPLISISIFSRCWILVTVDWMRRQSVNAKLDSDRLGTYVSCSQNGDKTMIRWRLESNQSRDGAPDAWNIWLYRPTVLTVIHSSYIKQIKNSAYCSKANW